jgi:Ca2+-binding EF-hand superfamily protein
LQSKRDTQLVFVRRPTSEPTRRRETRHADGSIPVARQQTLARTAARGFAQTVARAASRRVLAKEIARKVLPHATDEPADGPPRICIFFGSERVGPAAEEMASALAATLAPLGERGLVLLAGEPSLREAFGLAYGQSSHGVPLWSVLPDDRHSARHGSVDQEIHVGRTESECRDVFAQLGDLYVTLESGPDVEEVATAVAARGASLLPLAHDSAGRLGLLRQFPQRLMDRLFFTSLTAWEQLKRSGVSVGEAASLTAAALDAFLRVSEALQQEDVDAIEFEIEGLGHAAKIVEKSALTTPVLPGATHLLAYFRRPDTDSRVEWVTLDTRSQLLTDTFGHEGIPYRVMTDLVEVSEASMALRMSRRVSSVWDVQRYLTDLDNFEKHDFDPACIKAFKMCSVHGEISTDNLAEACSQLGHWMINQEWIQDIVRSKFNNVAFLDRREFAMFAGRYQELFKSCMSDRFSAVDRRSAGMLGPAEVAQFLRNMGVTPVKGVAEELMAEACTNKQRGPLDLGQFTTLNRIVWERAGFTLTEADVLLRDILVRFPALASSDLGEVGIEQLRLCTKWLGFPSSLKHWEVLQEVQLDDSPPSAVPPGREFLVLMRAQREQWIKTVKHAFSDHDEAELGESSADGSMEPRELQAFVRRLGFVALPEAVQEAVRDCQLESKTGLLLEDVYEILETLRQKDCFTRDDLEDVRQSYKRYSVDGMAGLTGVPLSSALRQAGWGLPVAKVQDMISHFDLDKSNDICEVEFVKLVRRLRQNLIEVLEQHFEDSQLHWPGKITEKEFRLAVARHLQSRLNVLQLMQVWDEHSSKFTETTDSWDWVRLVLDYCKAARDSCRENYGFDEEDVRAFHAQFSRHDSGTGVITLADKSLPSLLDETFPQMRSNREAYQKVAGWLAEVEQCKQGAIDFPEFLRMMRQVEDDADEELLALEEYARTATGLSRDEVKEFRSIFNSFDIDNSGQMSYGELRYLLGSLVHVDEGSGAGGALRAALAEVDEDGNKELSFPEFLRLMKRLQSENWNGINAAAKDVSDRVTQCLEEVQKETTPTARRRAISGMD